MSQYFDEAIDVLSQATNDAYVDLDGFQSRVNLKFQYVYKHFNKVDGRLDKVDKCLEPIDGHLNNMECHLKAMKDNMGKQFGQNLAFQRN